MVTPKLRLEVCWEQTVAELGGYPLLPNSRGHSLHTPAQYLEEAESPSVAAHPKFTPSSS